MLGAGTLRAAGGLIVYAMGLQAVTGARAIQAALAACSLLAMVTPASAVPQASFHPLGDLPGGAFASQGWGVSADGSTVVGFGTTDQEQEAFRWSASAGLQSLGALCSAGSQGCKSTARSVSADGMVVVGRSTSDSGVEAFRWTPSAGMVGLGDLDHPCNGTPPCFDSGAWVATLPLTEIPRVLIPLTGKRLLLKNKVPDDKEKNKGVWVAWDATVMAGARRTANDPRCNGDPPGTVKASIRFFSVSSGQDTGPLPLPCENWSALGLGEKPRGYRYKDPELDQGPCRLVLIRDGKRMKAVCRGSGAATDFLYDLSEGSDQGSVNVVLTTGVRDHCTAFSAFNGKTGADGKRFLGKNASPPSACAIPPAP
ncbi:MAG: hypothetical protein ACE5I7_16110 [Candidatus Binatia bacterium]